MEVPPGVHGDPTVSVFLWIINGLLALLAALSAYLFNDLRGNMRDLRNNHHKLANEQHIIKLQQANCVTRDELDKKFDSLRCDMREQHEETVTTMRAINSRIDDYMSKP